MGQITENSIKNDIKDFGIANGRNHKDAYGYYKKSGMGTDEIWQSEASSGLDKDGYRYVPMTGEEKKTEKRVDQFAEYMKSRQEKNEEEIISKEAAKREQKEDAKEVRQNLSSEELKQLRMMGIDIQSASMSDLRGIINTMRSNASREKTAELMASIKASNSDENISVVGANVMVAGTDVEVSDIDISDVVADKISGDRINYDIVINDRIGNDELVFIMKNNLPVTKETLYKAHFSGSKVSTEDNSEIDINELMPQIKKVITQAGYGVSEDTLDGAKLLLNNNLPVTTDNIKMYMNFQGIVGKSVSQTEDFVLEEINRGIDGETLFETVQNIKPETVYEMSLANREITIASIKKYSETSKNANENSNENLNENITEYVNDNNLSQDEKNAITAKRQMEEIRLMMTIDAAKRITSLDVNIDTRELSKVINLLKNVERKFIKEQFLAEGLTPTKQDIDVFKEVNAKVGELSNAPAGVIGLPIKGVEFTVNGLLSGKKSFEEVINSYEAVETVPRKDMGDSIQKAFSNIDDLLREQDIPVDYETERAARILGYNQLEITEENIYKVVEYDREVNDLINGFYPEAVMGIIKEGINPLDISIDELNLILRAKKYNEGVSDAENFATYLRDMESQGEISEKERSSYIGLYRVMNQLAKRGNREAGWIFANGSRLTIRNLIAGMRSIKNSGMDVSVDDDFGMLVSSYKKKMGMDEQIEAAFLADEKAQNEPENAESEKNAIIEELDRFISRDEKVISFMEENHIENTVINSIAASQMIKEGGIYEAIAQIMSKLKFISDSKDEMIDEAADDISSSLSGEEVAVDFPFEGILEQLGNEGKLSFTYEDMRNQILEYMYSAGRISMLSREDITSIKVACAGLNILSDMSRENKYQIPFETGVGIRVMNLIIKHGDAEGGNIRIDMEDDRMGHLHADINLDNTDNMQGYIVSSLSDINYRLMEKAKDVLVFAGNAGFDVSNVSLGSIMDAGSGRNDDADGEMGQSVSDRRLYYASVQIIKGLSEFFINDNME